MKNKYCEWCDNAFVPVVSYQIYCSPECREVATKEKILQRYVIQRRNKRSQKPRKCKSCGTVVSVYNDEAICNQCSINPVDVNKALKEIKEIIDENP